MNGPPDAAYAELLDRLYRRSRGGAPRDPRRTRRLLDRLAIPDPPAAVRVVGTNGKGGVAWRIDAGLRAAGARSLRFLSPHVERFEERVAVDGEEVSPDEVAAFLGRAWAEEPTPRAAFFELCLALALDVAARRGATWAVLEAGVGAARDATAAVRRARAVVITNVGEDHLDAIGPDLASVARDKAAAIEPGVPVLTGARGEALRVVRAVAAARGAPLRVLDGDDPRFALPPGVDADPAARASAALAVATLRELVGRDPALPRARLEDALRAAAVRPALPARRERFVRDGRVVVLDGAHNPPAAAALAAATPLGRHLLLGVLARKRPHEVAAALLPGTARTTLTAAAPGERPWGDDPRFVADPEAALEGALAALPAGGTLVVAGSLHLAGRLRPRLRAWAAGNGAGHDARGATDAAAPPPHARAARRAR